MARKVSNTKNSTASKKVSTKVKKVVKSTKPKAPAKNGVNYKKNSKKTVVPKKKIVNKIVKKAKKAVSSTVKKPKAVKKPAVSSGPKGYTPDQYQKYLAQKKRCQSLSNQALKDILRKNLQSMSGNKDDLIYKVADGIVLGRIPRCPSCFGGRPKFDFKKGTYYCSGYRDDEDFKNCHTSFQLTEIKRDPWQ